MFTLPQLLSQVFHHQGNTVYLFLLMFCLLLTGWQEASAAPYDPGWGEVGVFADAETCSRCHRASNDLDPAIAVVMRFPLRDDGVDISPGNQWRHSMMGQSFSDPYFRAAVEDEVSAFPALAGLIEDKCLTCHSPMAHTHAHQTNSDLTQDVTCPDPDGCYRLNTASIQDHAREGISCTLCHQIKSDNLGGAESFSGNFSIAAAGDLDAMTIYGPYQNPHPGGGNTMFTNSGYTPNFGSQVTTSEHCASCHTLYTPTVDVDTGQPTGTDFLEQGAFLEWRNSVYSTGAIKEQQCQGCHMPDPAPGAYNSRIAVRPNGSVNPVWPERMPFYTHSMVGGNAYMLELLRDNRVALGIENSTTVAGFDAKVAETRSLLQAAAAGLAVSRFERLGNELIIDVLLTNKTGHKLPTAYPSRRMWLHLTVMDDDNQLVFESGAPDADGHISTDAGRLMADCLARTKPPGFSNDGCFEPHRDVIDAAAQVVIYETVLGDTNDHITHVLLHADSYLKDNRIPPEGFTNDRADNIESQTKPAGIGNDADFNVVNNVEGSGSDTVHYRVPVDAPNTAYSVEVRLLYQAIQPGFIDGLQSSGNLVTGFKQMVTQLAPSVEVLSTSSATLPVDGTVDLSGTIKTPDGTDICAMVLASGQFMFSCNPSGVFSLTNLPRENDSTVKRQIYADGFFPKIDILTGSSDDAVVMTRSGACPNYNAPYTPAFVPGSAGKRINIAGKVLTQNSQTPICAMVLANGKHMFSCDGTGSYALNIPLDTNGQFKLQVYADGFAPTIQTFDEFSSINDVRMARATECQ